MKELNLDSYDNNLNMMGGFIGKSFHMTTTINGESTDWVFTKEQITMMHDHISRALNISRTASDIIVVPKVVTHKTRPAESLAGIALRKLGDETLWTQIAKLNSLKFPDMGPHNYYPVNTEIVISN